MQISLANAKKLNWLWQDENEIAWIETFLKIADKSGKIVPFKLTPEQKAEIVSVTKKADGVLDIVYRSADGSPVTTVPCPICGAAGLMSHHHCVACGTEFKDE